MYGIEIPRQALNRIVENSAHLLSSISEQVLPSRTLVDGLALASHHLSYDLIEPLVELVQTLSLASDQCGVHDLPVFRDGCQRNSL